MANFRTTGIGIESLTHPIDQLELVMADVELFLTEWLARVAQLNALPATPEALLRKRIRDFELEKSQWEAKRKRETQDVHDKAEELTKAWLRLEQEQRRFLQIRDANLHGARATAVESQVREHVDVSEKKVDQESSQSSPPAPVASEESNARRPSPLQGRRAGATAVGQFEQLRREIQLSRHQHRRV